MTTETPVPTWAWPEERLQTIMNRARAGRSLKPSGWPEGARCAVGLSFDSDHDTFELRDGGRSISALSQGQFGPRQGIPRIRELCAATIFLQRSLCLRFQQYIIPKNSAP